MPSRNFITREKSMPGFRTSKNRLTLLLEANVTGDFKLKPVLINHSKILGPLRIVMNLFLCSVNKTTKPEWWHICLQHGLLTILSPLLRLIVQKKKNSHFQTLLHVGNTPGQSRALTEMYLKINIVFMPANTTSILTDLGVIFTFKSYSLRNTFWKAITAIDSYSFYGSWQSKLKTFWKEFIILDTIETFMIQRRRSQYQH